MPQAPCIPVKNTFVHFSDSSSDLEDEHPVMKTQSEGARRPRRGHPYGDSALGSSTVTRTCSDRPSLFGSCEGSWLSCYNESGTDGQHGKGSWLSCYNESGTDGQHGKGRAERGPADEDAGSPVLRTGSRGSSGEEDPKSQAAAGKPLVMVGVGLEDTPAQLGQMHGSVRAEASHPMAGHIGSMTVVVEEPWGNLHVTWTIPMAFIESLNCKASSPHFGLIFPEVGPTCFQIGLYAAARRGTMSFREACGQGRMELKCLEQLPRGAGKINFFVTVGTKGCGQTQWLNMQHDFSEKSRCNMRRWDFRSAVDLFEETLTVDLCFGCPDLVR